jgi:hypothetical protein
MFDLRSEFSYQLYYISIFGAVIFSSCVTTNALEGSSLYTPHFTAMLLLTNCSYLFCCCSTVHGNSHVNLLHFRLVLI